MSVPENRSRDAESPEEDRTDRTLNDTDDERPLDRGQRNLCELGQELAFAHISERQHANQRCDELAAVAEEEEEDVQHEEEERGDPQHVLPDTQRAGRNELGDGDRGGRKALCQPLDIDAEPAEIVAGERGDPTQQSERRLQVNGAACDLVMKVDGFARHRQADEEQWDDNEGDDRQHRRQSRQRSPTAEGDDITALEREENGCEYRRPEHRHEEAADERQERERRQGDEEEERDVLDDRAARG
jgi:hypothetical protein